MKYITSCLALALCGSTLVACGGDEGNATFVTRGSLRQVFVTHASPGERLGLFDSGDRLVQEGTADKLGSLIFRKVPPAEGYRVKNLPVDPSAQQTGPRLRVFAAEGSTPPPSFYADQKLRPGFGYIQTRDGTQLSIYVTMPGPPENGPYPTVVNYSGYSPSKPGKPIGNFEFLCGEFPTLCDAPDDPSAIVASLFGYATVGVNLRGTGCSGGAYDFFEELQVLDGYDVVQTVAAQDFVKDHKVGMTGISFPGISQLFVGRSKPPGLAAITPLSVIGNTATTMSPGGILNVGFAANWIKNVLTKADPYGQGWEKEVVAKGDQVCYENQLLHGQKMDNVAEAMNTPYYVPERVDPLNPTTFVSQIEVPVFMVNSYQDEQTGPYFTSLMDQFTKAPLVRMTIQNGVHPDSLSPANLVEWVTFLDLFVAKRVPKIKPTLRQLSPLLFEEIFGAQVPLPPERFGDYKTHAEALAAFQADLPVRALFESGGSTEDPGAPVPRFEARFAAWPPAEVKPVRYYLAAGPGGVGRLASSAPAVMESGSLFLLDPAAGERVNLARGSVFDKLPKYDWRQLLAGKAVSFVSDPLPADQVFLGTGSADLWVKSTADDADLQVSISEVRADGKEIYIQSGWLRASHRALSPKSTELWPEQTHLEKDAAPLSPGQWALVRVPIAGFGHVFRKGSQIRFVVDTPGDVRAEWRFGLKKFPGPVSHTVGHSAVRPSSVALPLVHKDLVVPQQAPVCPGLRGQPCRKYLPFENVPG